MPNGTPPAKMLVPFTESKGLTAMVAQVAISHKPAVSGSRQHDWIRALDRARLVATRKPTYLPQFDRFRVFSERVGITYKVYPVEVDGHLTYECSCIAAEHGQICWHAALIASLPQEVARRQKPRAEKQVLAPAVNPLVGILD